MIKKWEKLGNRIFTFDHFVISAHLMPKSVCFPPFGVRLDAFFPNNWIVGFNFFRSPEVMLLFSLHPSWISQCSPEKQGQWGMYLPILRNWLKRSWKLANPQICGMGRQAGDLVRADVIVCVEGCHCGALGKSQWCSWSLQAVSSQDSLFPGGGQSFVLFPFLADWMRSTHSVEGSLLSQSPSIKMQISSWNTITGPNIQNDVWPNMPAVWHSQVDTCN